MAACLDKTQELSYISVLGNKTAVDIFCQMFNISIKPIYDMRQ